MRTLILALLVNWSVSAEGLFQSMTYEQAVQASLQSKKPLLLEWTANWCAPCKVMQKTTFQEAGVIDFCQQRFLPVQFDLDRDSELAKALRVDTVPTLLLMSGGQEVDRTSGLKSAPELLDWLAKAGQGPNQLERFKSAVAANPDDANARWELAQAYEERQMWPEASSHLLWLWDEVELVEQQSLAAVRQSFLASSLKKLAKAHPPLRESLRQRLEALQLGLAVATPTQLQDWLKLHEILGTEADAAGRVLEQPEFFHGLKAPIFVLLCSQGHWSKAGSWLQDPMDYARSIWDGRLRLEESSRDMVAPMSEITARVARGSSYRQWGDLVKALNAGGRAPEAVEILYWIRSQDPDTPL